MTAYVSSQSGLASAASTWNNVGHPSANGDTFTISVGHVVTWDLDLTGLSTGLGACTINGTFQASTTAGSYGAKCNGTWTFGASASFLVNNGTGVPYPSGCTFQQNFNGNFSNTLNAATIVNIICQEPTHKFAKLTQQDNSGQAILHVDTDLTQSGDSAFWVNNALVRVDNVGVKFSQSEQYTISSVTSTTITLTTNLSNNKVAGSVVSLVSRNIKITSTGSSGSAFSGGTGIVVNAEVRGVANGFNNCTGVAVGGTVSGSTNGFNNTTGSISAVIAGCSTASLNCFNLSVSSPVITGCTIVFNSLTGGTCSSLISGCGNVYSSCFGVLQSGSIIGCQYAFINSGGYRFTGPSITNSFSACANSTGGQYYGSVFSGNTADIDLVADGAVFYNTQFGSTPPFSGYNSSNFSLPWSYTESVDHNGVVGAFMAWCLGGIVSNVASPVYDSTRVRSYQHAATSASAYVFRQQHITVPPSGSVNVRCYAQADTAMAYLPRLWIFTANKEPLISGSPDVEVTMPTGYSTNTWYVLTGTYTNTTNEPVPVIVRTLAKNASGNVYFDPVVMVSSFIPARVMEGAMS